MWLLACAASVFAQGEIILYNHVNGSVITHVYGPGPSIYGFFTESGNGANDFPAGTADWSAFTALSGTGWTAELWGGPLGTPESALVPVGRTTFLTVPAGAGTLSNAGAVHIPGVPEGASATVMLRVWDNVGGTVTSWAMAQTPFTISGESPLFATPPLGLITIPVPSLVGLQSFNVTWGCLGPYFEGAAIGPGNQSVMEGGTVSFYAYAIACPPASFQWYHDGVLVGTGGEYQIANAQPADAGSYWAVAYGIAVNGMAVSKATGIETLTVLTPPSITSQPNSQTAEVGSTVSFGVRADGIPPPLYQWFYNGSTALTLWRSDATLVLTDVQPAQSGSYTAVASNSVGTQFSTPALLNVVPVVSREMVPALSLVGQSGSPLNLESTEAFGPGPTWRSLASVPMTNTTQWYFDLTTPPAAQRFYRAWQVGSPSPSPDLGIDLVPAIGLTGPVGSSVRLDYINQFGPIDPWQTLATVVLTNGSELYFDTSVIGQPARLYRVVPAP